MERHAGFAAAISVGEAFINQSLSAAVADASPLADSQLFMIPTSVPLVGGDTVRLSGIGLFEQRPQVRLAANPANTVTMAASAIVFVTGTTNTSIPFAQISETWKVRLTGTAAVGVDVDVAPDGIFLRWIPAASSISGLSVTVLQGPPPPPWLAAALNSPPVRAALSFAIQQLRPIRVTPKLLDRDIVHRQSCDIRSTGVSEFEWFVIAERVSRAVVRILDGAVAIGVDLQDRTAGDPTQLLDIRRRPGDAVAYRWLVRDNVLPTDRPLLVPHAIADDRDIAVLVNGGLIGAVVATVSSQIADTPIAPGVRFKSVAMRPERFVKPLRGPEMALRVDVTVNHNVFGDVHVALFLQPYLLEDGSGSPNPTTPLWFLYLGHIDVDVPWWIDVAIVVLGIALSAAFPVLTPLVAIGVIAAIDGIIPGAIDSATGEAIAAQGRGVFLVVANRASTLPTQKQQSSWETVNAIAVSSEGVDLRMSIVAPSVRFGSLDDTVDVARLVCVFDANHKGPYRVAVQLRQDLQFLAASCAVQIVVTTSSTGAEVARAEGAFANASRLQFSHLTAALYHEDVFTVHARVWLDATGLTGLLFSADVDVTVTDVLDRHRPFATWDEHWAHFRNAGTAWQWWHRFSKPKIHRTATSARCAALRRAATRPHPPTVASTLRYLDELGFDWENIPAHRDEVCDHCFFDTPTSPAVSPREDWFTNRFTWPTTSEAIIPSDATDHGAAAGPPDGTVWVVDTGKSARFGHVRRRTCLDLAEILRPEAIIAGDVPDWRVLGRAHVVAFERNGNAPAASGGWESSSFTFDDDVTAVTVNWDSRVGAARDPHVLANGSIRGADYIRGFGVLATSPEAQIAGDEVISFLLFNLDELNSDDEARDFFTITVSGFAPGPDAEASPDIDAIAYLVQQG
jgi:hypothetical protein